MAEWMTVASVTDVPEGTMITATLEGEDVVIANVGGTVRAFGPECTHAGCNLGDDGELGDGEIECMCHGSIFDLETGEAIGPPATDPLPVYPARAEGDEIQLSGPT